MRVSAALLVAGLPLAAGPSALAQGVPVLLDAAWIGFEAGYEPSPFGPATLAAGDLDGDGDLDVLTGNDYFRGPGLAVLRNAGDGTFAAHDYRRIAVGEEPGAVALADLDGDGDLDAFATIPGWDMFGTTLRLWRNDGSGLLGPQEDYPVGEGPQGLVVADINGDGFPDVATADHGRVGRGTTVSLLFHNGLAGPAAGLLGARSVDVGPRPFRLAAADLDRDGDLDLAVARGDVNNDTVITLLVNDGTGSFPPPHVELPAGRSFKPAVGLADLDGDGDPELVTSEPDAVGERLAVRRNDGAGGFSPPVFYPLDPWCPTTIGLAFADLDGDGATDVVTANPSGRSFEGIRVLRNDGAGGLLAPARYETAQNTEAVAAFDADGDGDTDLVSLAHSSATLALHRNPGTGVFPRAPRTPTASFPAGLETADLDGDGDLDLALADNAQLYLHDNDGAGGFSAAEASRPAVSPARFRLADLDGDGLSDLVVPAGPGVHVARNLGGAFDSLRTITVGTCNQAVAAGDLDGDGDPDLAAADCAFPPVVHLLRNDGGLTFVPAGEVSLTLASERLLLADADGDGRLDLVVSEGGYGVSTFLNAGGFAFSAAVASLASDPPYLIAASDFDQDGLPDLAVQVPADAFGTDRVGIARGLGDGSFAVPAWRLGSSALEILRIGTDLDVSDVDCDGLVDVVVTSYAANDLGVFLSRGDGTLEPEVRYGPGITPQHAVLGDFTGDGVTDAVVTIHSGGSTCCEEAVALLRGLCGCGADPIPPDQGNVLRAVRTGGDVVLSWTGTTASRWRLFRDLTKTALGRTALVPDATANTFTDPNAVARGGLDFYRLKGLSPCSATPGP